MNNAAEIIQWFRSERAKLGQPLMRLSFESGVDLRTLQRLAAGTTRRPQKRVVEQLNAAIVRLGGECLP